MEMLEAPMNGLEDEMRIDQLQEEAANNAEQIGLFRLRFHSFIEDAVNAGEITNAAEADRRLEIVDAVTSGQDDIRLDTMENHGVLGYNTIGGGRAGVHLNRDTLASIDSKDHHTSMEQVIAHEEAHGDQTFLDGELTIDGQIIDHELLYEGHAEVNGNEGAGMSITNHREGQPQEVYAEGQNIALSIIQKAGRSLFERVMTETGEVSELQKALAA